jgi:hypothetical protein
LRIWFADQQRCCSPEGGSAASPVKLWRSSGSEAKRGHEFKQFLREEKLSTEQGFPFSSGPSWLLYEAGGAWELICFHFIIPVDMALTGVGLVAPGQRPTLEGMTALSRGMNFSLHTQRHPCAEIAHLHRPSIIHPTSFIAIRSQPFPAKSQHDPDIDYRVYLTEYSLNAPGHSHTLSLCRLSEQPDSNQIFD